MRSSSIVVGRAGSKQDMPVLTEILKGVRPASLKAAMFWTSRAVAA
jgi:hypothetical protein